MKYVVHMQFEHIVHMKQRKEVYTDDKWKVAAGFNDRTFADKYCMRCSLRFHVKTPFECNTDQLCGSRSKAMTIFPMRRQHGVLYFRKNC